MIPKSYKDQHFLTDEKILKKEITIAKLKKTDKIIEIGAGDGRLTKLIDKKAGEVLSFETDKQFKEALSQLNLKNTKILFKNALKHSWRGFNKIIANLPYSLSEPTIQKAIKEEIKELTLIVGKKFAKKLKDSSTKIGIIANLYFKIYLIEEIPKSKFTPKPRVNSYLIHLKRKKPTEFELVLQSILEKESKTKNALIKILINYGKTKRQAKEIVSQMGIDKKGLEKSIKTASTTTIKTIKENLKKFLKK